MVRDLFGMHKALDSVPRTGKIKNGNSCQLPLPFVNGCRNTPAEAILNFLFEVNRD